MLEHDVLEVVAAAEVELLAPLVVADPELAALEEEDEALVPLVDPKPEPPEEEAEVEPVPVDDGDPELAAPDDETDDVTQDVGLGGALRLPPELAIDT